MPSRKTQRGPRQSAGQAKTSKAIELTRRALAQQPPGAAFGNVKIAGETRPRFQQSHCSEDSDEGCILCGDADCNGECMLDRD